MALFQDVIKAKDKLELESAWSTYTLTANKAKTIFFILLKDTKDTVDATISRNKVTRVGIEIGIDSGVDGLIIPIKTLDFEFRFKNSIIDNIDERTASIIEHDPLQRFYFRVKYIETTNKIFTLKDEEQTIDIALNINELSEV